MGAKPKYPLTLLKVLLYQTKQDNPGKELNPSNLSQITEVPLHVWRDRMKPYIELINDKEYVTDQGLLKSPESMPFPIINYANEFRLLLENNDEAGILDLAKEVTVSHMKLLNRYHDRQMNNNKSEDEHHEELERLKGSFEQEINKLKSRLEDEMQHANDWEQKYKKLAVKALRNIDDSKNNIVHLSPLSSGDNKRITDTL